MVKILLSAQEGLIRNPVQGVKQENYRGIFHCFTGELDQAREVISLGFLLGIGGVTYRRKR